jgi:protein disulfide-isomerase
MRPVWQSLLTVFGLLMATPAWAQQDTIHWHNDLESAKTVARESRRLVLVHFWTPSCVPCKALEQNVFSQPGVASAIEQDFVPVKLNADENSATAQSFGITRVPTDVVITPDGQMVGKLVSPATPAAYVGEVRTLAAKYATNTGQLYAGAISTAPAQQPLLNNAYSRLQVSPNTPPIVPPTGSGSPNFATVPAATSPIRPAMTPALPVAQTIGPQNGAASNYAMPPLPQNSPQVTNNPAAMTAQVGQPQSQITPIGGPSAPPVQPQATAQSAANPYFAAGATLGGAASLPGAPPNSPLPVSPAAAPLAYGAPSAPPALAANPAAPAAPAGPVAPGAVPDPRLLPAGAPPLAFEGYCPVSMRNKWQWVPGNPQYGVVHMGRTYWFAGAEEQKQFWTDPNRYAPALSGNDPVLAIDHKQQIPGKREHSLDYDGLFYMFASEATLQQFTANPARYAAGARQAMGLPRGRLVR